MRPQAQYYGNNYPLAIGLGILLLPYIWSALLFPFRLSSYLSGSGKSTAKVVKTTTSLTSSIARPSTTTTAAGFNLWKGVRGVIGPKWEAPPGKSTKSVSTKTTSKYTKKGKSTVSVSVSVSISTTTVKDVKTVTKSVTHQKGAKTVTKSVTQTVAVEKVVEKVVEKAGEAKPDESVIIIEEISIMGWHQVSCL
jgi:hypothetical protein